MITMPNTKLSIPLDKSVPFAAFSLRTHMEYKIKWNCAFMSDYKGGRFRNLPPLCVDYYFTRSRPVFAYREVLFYGVPVYDISVNVD